MREIKFRAWDISKKCFIPMEVYAIITTDFNAFGVMLKDWENYREGEYFYDNSQVLSQFTGLKDKNGVDIYEGDIVEKFRTRDMSGNDVEYWKEAVEFEIGKETSGFYIPFLENCEVIGNIYEHKHLLK